MLHLVGLINLCPPQHDPITTPRISFHQFIVSLVIHGGRDPSRQKNLIVSPPPITSHTALTERASVDTILEPRESRYAGTALLHNNTPVIIMTAIDAAGAIAAVNSLLFSREERSQEMPPPTVSVIVAQIIVPILSSSGL